MEEPKQPHAFVRILAGNLLALVVCLLIGAAAEFGVISIGLGVILLVVAGIVGTVLVCTEMVPESPASHKVGWCVGLWVLVVVIGAVFWHLSPKAAVSSYATATPSISASQQSIGHENANSITNNFNSAPKPEGQSVRDAPPAPMIDVGQHSQNIVVRGAEQFCDPTHPLIRGSHIKNMVIDSVTQDACPHPSLPPLPNQDVRLYLLHIPPGKKVTVLYPPDDPGAMAEASKIQAFLSTNGKGRIAPPRPYDSSIIAAQRLTIELRNGSTDVQVVVGPSH